MISNNDPSNPAIELVRQPEADEIEILVVDLAEETSEPITPAKALASDPANGAQREEHEIVAAIAPIATLSGPAVQELAPVDDDFMWWRFDNEDEQRQRADELLKRSEADVERLRATYPLPELSVLVTLTWAMHCNAPGVKAWAYTQPPLSDEAVAVVGKSYRIIHAEIAKLQQLRFHARRGLERVVSGDTIDKVRSVQRALGSLAFQLPLHTPRSHRSVRILEDIGYLGRYLLLVTDGCPMFWQEDGQPTWQRVFVSDVMQTTGSGASEDEIDEACAAIARELIGKKGTSAHLRISRQEKRELRAWQAENHPA